jgi:L-alanine-DL-glutamate epimerase-like enolase superfamily enzyme
VVCEISGGGCRGRGEAAGVPYCGETPKSICDDINGLAEKIKAGIDRAALSRHLPPCGARNALDCALWDLEAKQLGKTVWQMIGIEPRAVDTAYTIGIGELDEMHRDARLHRHFPVLKVKVGNCEPLEQVEAVKTGAPDAALIVDANQAWTIGNLEKYVEPLSEFGVQLIEQPIHRKDDETLRGFQSPVPLCADESCATSADLERLCGLYSAINNKLDKTGGLTEALVLAAEAEKMGFELMVGNMMGSSLAMAPAFVIAQKCRWVDLDGPLLLWWDGLRRLRYNGSQIEVFDPALWG